MFFMNIFILKFIYCLREFFVEDLKILLLQKIFFRILVLKVDICYVKKLNNMDKMFIEVKIKRGMRFSLTFWLFGIISCCYI